MHFFCDIILTVITLAINGRDENDTVNPHHVSEDPRSDFHAIRRSSLCHVFGRIDCSIVTRSDSSDHATSPTRFRYSKKIDFKLEKSIFNPGKSLKIH